MIGIVYRILCDGSSHLYILVWFDMQPGMRVGTASEPVLAVRYNERVHLNSSLPTKLTIRHHTRNRIGRLQP